MNRWPRPCGLACIAQGVMVIAAATSIAGCGTTGPAVAPSALPAAHGIANGQVLGRNERFVVYQPDAGDTHRSIAARFLGSESRDWVIGDFNGTAEPEAGRPLVVPLQDPNPIGVHADHYQTVPILCYHRFGGGGGRGDGGVGGTSGTSKMVVSAAAFAAQLDWLARNDYRVIGLSQLAGFLEGRQALPQRSVVITIDDGYESVYRLALPLLRRHGFKATLFVYTDFIGAADALNWAQLQELAASGLVDVQAHSKTHRDLLEREAGESEERYRQRVEAEARVPREVLERRLGVTVRRFAYPYGDANQVVLEALGRQHYQMGVTVSPGGNGFFVQPLMLRRTMVYGDQDLASFKAKLQVARAVGAP